MKEGMSDLDETDWTGEGEEGNLPPHLNAREGGSLPAFLADTFVSSNYVADDLIFTRHGSHDGVSGVDMARFSGDTLRIFPKQGSDKGPDPAHHQLREIRLLGMKELPHEELSLRSGPYLEGLPKGLGSSFHYGLNFPVRYRCIATAIEEQTSCTVLRLTHDERAEIQGTVLSVPYARFHQLVSEIDANYNRASAILGRIRAVSARNLIAEAQGQATQEPTRGRNPAIQKMTDAIRGQAQLDDTELVDLIDLLVGQADKTARRQPAAIGRLRNDLNLVTLEVLVEEYRAALDDKAKAANESFWQRFFTDNPFALQQLFGAPVAHVSTSQLQVLSPKSDGKGARITDFLLANALTGEGLVVEIKTPAARLMEEKPYRGAGSSAVLRPHNELAGAVAQLQSQKDSLRDKLRERLAYDDPLAALKHASPRGALIVGTVGNLEGSTLDSFRRYRDGLHDVALLGFDEVADRLQVLLNLLKASEKDLG